MKGIRRLAQELDISIGTISRALNGRADVSPDTRQRVLEAAAAMGYVPNQAGRSLRQGNTNAIGFMIELGADVNGGNDNFFMGVFDGVQSVLARHHLDLIVLPCPTGEDPAVYLQRMMARRLVDGLIISATHRKDTRIDMLTKMRIPFITLGRSNTPGDYPWIDLDFDGAARRAIDRLVSAGHSRIAVAVPGNDINLGFIFLDGYKAALARHGIAFDPSMVFRVPSSELGGYQLGHELLAMKDRPSAVILNYELLALGLYRQLGEAGLQAGRDLAVIGFRENPVSRYMSPRLTCFRLSLTGLGAAIGEALLATMPAYAEAYPLGRTQRIWPMELVPGESDGA
ncbi:LacI family DNA-binding transcriptional regulator [Devosia sp. BK]|uniref:LacI family DNA-binding transcriptional regulator n=1 Tax=Devosia sp. BK TaxID=2871706 RepID=UPI00293B7CBF|nr:LacI family DNA-binding transcriptional regulator [Devosia sp. BK]MDV3250403.1 LacI family DNA-binding transcriptional regulator [Devosia sp. BK]